MRCARHGLMMYRRYSLSSGEPTGSPICGACVQENASSSPTAVPAARPDPTIVIRDSSALIPAVCIVVMGVVLLVAMLRYG